MAKKKEVKVGEDNKPTAAQIKAWKDEHGEIHRIKIEDHIAIVRKPKLRDLKLAQMAGKQKSDIDVAESLYNNCLLFEDDKIRKDDTNYMAAIVKMGEIIEIKEAELEKL